MLAYLIQQVETGSKLTFDFLKSCCLKTNTEEKTNKLLNQKKQNQKKQMMEEQKKHTVAFACTPEHTLNFIELIL